MQNIFQARVDDSTLSDVTSEERNRGRRMMSLLTILVLVVLVLLALFGLTDLTGKTSAQTQDFTVDVEYPKTTRAGNEIDLRFTIDAVQPLPSTVKISLNEDYLMFFEDFAVFPDPEAQASNAEGVIEFELSPQTGERQMVVVVTGRASDRWEARTDGQLQVSVGQSQAELPVTTWRVP